jgi:hypothetical protein
MKLQNGVETKEDAFLIGYLMGDATFRFSKRKLASGEYSIHPRMYVSDSCDLDILNWIVDNYPNSGIKTRIKNVKGKDYTTHTLYFPKTFMVHLEQFGLFHHKADRFYNNIPDSFFIYFLQGLSLADGCVYIRDRSDCATPRLNFCIAHQSYRLFEFLQDRLNNEYDYPIKLRERKNENVIYLDCQHTNLNKVFLRKLYADPIIHHKKVNKFWEYVNLYPEDEIKYITA